MKFLSKGTAPLFAVLVLCCSPAWGAKGDAGQKCVECHAKLSPALVMEWKRSLHAENDVTCLECHQADKKDPDAWKHEGEWIATLVTPKDCAQCHDKEYDEFKGSHHAKAGEILASLDNMLAEKVCGMPANNADAINGCLQCHGSIIQFKKDEKGEIIRSGPENKPVLDPATWPNSGIGRMNLDGSKGSCNACHSRHSFEAKLARSPENCGKCHLGPDHPQKEIYDESKHGIAFYANRDRMALDKDGDWILGKDYSAAPTCATCHISGYMTPDGEVKGNSHDVGERISWTLRPVVSTKLNLVVFEDGFKEDFPEGKALPQAGDELETTEKVVEEGILVSKKVTRQVEKVVTWEDRRGKMKAMCLNCHSGTHIDNFYEQFDGLVSLYNEKFAKPANKFMNELTADGILAPDAPFAHDVQWQFWELWHHDGRRARHGASMMGPDYTHWHGMYEVAKRYYTEFLPSIIEAAEKKSPEMKEKWEAKIADHLKQAEHSWLKGLGEKEAEALRKMYQDRYNQGVGSGAAKSDTKPSEK